MASLESYDVTRIRAPNPGPLTLSGTNTWVLGRDPAHVVDPGPDLPAHLQAIGAEVNRRGGLGAIAITHDHLDHREGCARLAARFRPAPVGAATGADIILTDGDRLGPLTVVATPGHAPEHLAFVAGPVCFTGDAVLGEGSVFIAPGPGSLADYLNALRRLRELDLSVLCPGHGPPLWDPQATLDAYLAHRLEREQALVAALAGGGRTVDELLDAAWGDVAVALRPAAGLTLAAHLDKLAEEGRLPVGVERPSWPPV